jgi:hypothetical protein
MSTNLLHLPPSLLAPFPSPHPAISLYFCLNSLGFSDFLSLEFSSSFPDLLPCCSSCDVRVYCSSHLMTLLSAYSPSPSPSLPCSSVRSSFCSFVSTCSDVLSCSFVPVESQKNGKQKNNKSSNNSQTDDHSNSPPSSFSLLSSSLKHSLATCSAPSIPESRASSVSPLQSSSLDFPSLSFPHFNELVSPISTASLFPFASPTFSFQLTRERIQRLRNEIQKAANMKIKFSNQIRGEKQNL